MRGFGAWNFKLLIYEVNINLEIASTTCRSQHMPGCFLFFNVPMRLNAIAFAGHTADDLYFRHAATPTASLHVRWEELEEL